MRLITGSAERIAAAADIARRYNDGASLRDIVAQTGRSYGVVRALVVEGGAVIRPAGHRPTPTTDQELTA
jgi:hypothetical protein